jgi:hypothetical protein
MDKKFTIITAHMEIQFDEPNDNSQVVYTAPTPVNSTK